ncbi:MAG: TRAP transporter small permease subunit [Boseongicola sp. SB0667_bin_21]|nr:TRAP transporter small permease subunit [Boseongicola sp. SB0667_bin_21]
MSTAPDPDVLSRHGTPAPVTRVFGWAMLSVLAAFMINNVFIVGWGFPKPTQAFGGDGRALLLVAIYVLLVALAVFWVLRTPDRALRYDARAISDFNAYLIRGCYFAVLFTGIADATIAFIRVEGLLPYVFGEKLSHDLIRSHFIGPWIHLPLAVLGFVVAAFSRSLGFIWLALLIVMAELLIVFSRFVFSYEQALMGDLVRYWYAALFLFSSAYTLLEEGHVRVDVLYAGFDVRRKGRVNAVGSILLGMSTCWVIILVGMGSANAIVNSPVRNFEVSQTGTAGMYTKYQMAAFLGIFAITMLIQFVSYMFEAVADMRDEPGHRDAEPVGH